MSNVVETLMNVGLFSDPNKMRSSTIEILEFIWKKNSKQLEAGFDCGLFGNVVKAFLLNI